MRLIFRPKSEIQTFFPPKNKKRSSPNLRLMFWPKSEIQTFEGGLFSYGRGYFQFFTKNRPQNHQKRAILHTSQANGGLEPPPAPWLRYWVYPLHPPRVSASLHVEHVASPQVGTCAASIFKWLRWCLRRKYFCNFELNRASSIQIRLSIIVFHQLWLNFRKSFDKEDS